MAFDRRAARQMHEELAAAVKAVVEKHTGVSIEKHSATFSDNEFRFNVRLATKGKNGSTPQEEAFRQAAAVYGFKPDLLGKQVVYAGTRFTVLGFESKRPKYPIVAENGNGKRYKLPLEAVGASKRMGASFDLGGSADPDDDDEW